MDAIETIRPSLLRNVTGDESRFAYEFQCAEGNPILRLWHLYCALAAKRRSRLALQEMSMHLLKDIGLTEVEAQREASVPFWR
ncbi:hypothetical protein AU381_15495 [Sinorhizobium glycinis]|uniref:YjiS-like domain-containing protein n=1 Tax=Sinorhizobium glycinis TaxID=1472378 RepID=A0A178Y5G7_9HYPH|nr:DUF1127 domain-containing protein [Sinorhizobium glycinis]OAP42584.1 hypothetical protein AU381_15495 [Sinorhizobium glycinis]